jgi:hypothetical protein
MKAGTVPPATCVALKEMFIDTDAAAGARILKCAADGVSWEGMDDSGVAASIPFSGITSGTNSAAAMHVGTGASLDATGSGTIAATTAVALAANPANCAAGNSSAGVDASGVAEGCAARAQTLANVANKWLNSYDATTGLFTQTQPSSSNLSDSANVALYNAGDKTWGPASAFTWTFDGGANTDPALTFTSGVAPAISSNSTFSTSALGSLTAPSFNIATAGHANGMLLIANGQLGFVGNDTFLYKSATVSGAAIAVSSSLAIGFLNGTGTGNAIDTFLTRCAAACVQLWCRRCRLSGSTDATGSGLARRHGRERRRREPHHPARQWHRQLHRK